LFFFFLSFSFLLSVYRSLPRDLYLTHFASYNILTHTSSSLPLSTSDLQRQRQQHKYNTNNRTKVVALIKRSLLLGLPRVHSSNQSKEGCLPQVATFRSQSSFF
jgi:hypothetical protein